VMSAREVERVIAAGGRLIVSPHSTSEVTIAAKAAGAFAIPGFFTPTEGLAMLADGADALKLFPAEAASPAMLKAVRAVLPAATMVLPVGGVGPGSFAPWLAAGAAGFGIGSALYKPGDTADTVSQRARTIVAELAELRGGKKQTQDGGRLS